MTDAYRVGHFLSPDGGIAKGCNASVRLLYSAKIKKGTVRLDKLKEKQGLEGITATVKKSYAARRAGQSVKLSLNGAPHTSITLEKGGSNSAEL